MNYSWAGSHAQPRSSSEVVAASEPLRQHPRFPEALAKYAAAVLMPDGSRAMRKLLQNGHRYVLGLALIGLDFAWRTGAGQLPTPSLLQAVLGGRRQVPDQVAAFIKLGLATRQNDRYDGRLRRIVPTVLLIEEIGRHARACIDMHTLLAKTAPLVLSTDMLACVVAAIAAVNWRDGDLLERFPRVARFSTRDGGYLLLVMLYWQTHLEAPGKPLSMQPLADCISVSKSQVAVMLRDGLAARDLERRGRSDVALSRETAKELERFIASQSLLFGAAAQAVAASRGG